MNNISIVGRLTRDVDLKYSQNGVAHAGFTVAVNRPFKNQQGEYEADFIRCKAFKERAETLANYVKKGQQIAINGRLQTGSYQNQEGATVYTSDVMVDQFTFISDGSRGNQQGNNQNYQQQNNQSYQQNTQQQQNNAFENDGQAISIQDDDLPF